MTQKSQYKLIARSGWMYAGLSCIFIFVLYYYVGLVVSLVFWPLPFLLLYMFRDPTRQIPPIPLAIVSPCDGVISEVRSIYDRYLNREAIKVRIHMGLFDVYTARNPIEGKILQQWYRLKSSVNEKPHFAQWIQTDEGDDIMLLIFPHKWSLQPRCESQISQRVGQGQPCSFINFGADIEVWLPQASNVSVQAGQKVIGGESVLAQFIHKKLPV